MAKTDLRNLNFGHLKSKLAEVTVPPTHEPTEASTARQRGGRGISDRGGKGHIGGNFDPELHRTLKRLAVDEGKDIRDLMVEAFNLLLRSRGLPGIAE